MADMGIPRILHKPSSEKIEHPSALSKERLTGAYVCLKSVSGPGITVEASSHFERLSSVGLA
jgi:hypothetical protein